MSATTRLSSIAAILVAAIVCAQDAAAEDPAEIYTLAANYFRHERWELACEEFQRLLSEAPEHALADDARFYLGESLVRCERHAEAADVWLEYLRREHDPQHMALARFRAGECCYLAGRFDDASPPLERFVAEAPESPLSPRALIYLGNAAAAGNAYREALASFGRFTALYPTDELFAAAVFAQVQAHVQLGDDATAWTILRSLYEAAPDAAEFVEAAWWAAEILERLNRDEDALKAARGFLAQCESDDERRFEVLLRTARILERQAQLDAAGKAYEQLIAQFPAHAERDVALYEAAWLAMKLGRAAEAVAQFELLVAECPRSTLKADALYRLAEYDLSAKKPEEACRKLATAAEAAGDELLPHILLLESQTLAAVDRKLDAEEALDALLQRFPRHPLAEQAAFAKAEIAFRAGEFEDAAERFAALDEMKPQDDSRLRDLAKLRRVQALVEARRWTEVLAAASEGKANLPALAYEFDYLIGRAHAARAEFDLARTSYARVLDDEHTRGTETAALAQFMTAETYFHQRDFETALREYLRVDALHRHAAWQAAALLQAGKCQEQLGKPHDARGCYEQLLSEHATSAYAAEARRRRDAALQQAENAAPAVQRK